MWPINTHRNSWLKKVCIIELTVFVDLFLIWDEQSSHFSDPLICSGFFCKDERCLPPAVIPSGNDEVLESLGVSRHDEIHNDEWKHVGFGTEVSLLFKREIIHNSRNKKGVGARFALTTFMSILVGNIFFGVGRTSSYTDPSVRIVLHGIQTLYSLESHYCTYPYHIRNSTAILAQWYEQLYECYFIALSVLFTCSHSIDA